MTTEPKTTFGNLMLQIPGMDLNQVRFFLEVQLPHMIGILDTEREALKKAAQNKLKAIENASVPQAYPMGRYNQPALKP